MNVFLARETRRYMIPRCVKFLLDSNGSIQVFFNRPMSIETGNIYFVSRFFHSWKSSLMPGNLWSLETSYKHQIPSHGRNFSQAFNVCGWESDIPSTSDRNDRRATLYRSRVICSCNSSKIVITALHRIGRPKRARKNLDFRRVNKLWMKWEVWKTADDLFYFSPNR